MEARRLSPLSSRSVETSVSGLVTTMPDTESLQFSSWCAIAGGLCREYRPASAAANPGADMPSVAATPCCCPALASGCGAKLATVTLLEDLELGLGPSHPKPNKTRITMTRKDPREQGE
jgi:hypothetical protein